MFYLAKIVKSCQNAKLYSIDNVKIAGFVNCVLQQENALHRCSVAVPKQII